ncbi:MAG: hypothetical protein LBQ98_01900 [Nitrososphaerota archaeon]|nr:hypothetical protein [Nitrososphaerota archaeon]
MSPNIQKIREMFQKGLTQGSRFPHTTINMKTSKQKPTNNHSKLPNHTGLPTKPHTPSCYSKLFRSTLYASGSSFEPAAQIKSPLHMSPSYLQSKLDIQACSLSSICFSVWALGFSHFQLTPSPIVRQYAFQT